MKRMLIVLFAMLVAGSAIIILVSRRSSLIDTSFATSATLKYHYDNKAIDVKAKNNDLRALKEILRGYSYSDNPACGFTTDVSITLTDGQKSLVFCPACDGCHIIQIHSTNKYIGISKQQRKQLNGILAKYGMVFPCI